MDNSDYSTDINNYSTDELIDLLELEDNFSLEELELKTNQYIERFKSERPDLTKFFIKVRETLMKQFEEESDEKDSDEDDERTTINNNNIFKSPEILPQNYPTYGEYGPKKENPLNSIDKIFQTYSKNINPGTLNPFYRKQFKKSISIDSRYRDDYFRTPSNNFHITFPETIKNVFKMSVSNVDIINAHYTINAIEGTNYMRITILDVCGNETIKIPIEIEPGNLFADDLSTEINRQIKLYFASEGYDVNKIFPADEGATSNSNHLLKCNISATSGRSFFTLAPNDVSNATPGGTIDYDLSFAQLELDFTNPIQKQTNKEMPPFLTLGWIMGFRNEKYKGAKAYKSESIFNAAGKQSVFVSIDDYNQNFSNTILLYHGDTFFSKNIITRVPLNDGKFSINFNDRSDKKINSRDYYGPVDIQKLRIQLIDEFGLPFDNNNMDYTIVLEFECLYQM